MDGLWRWVAWFLPRRLVYFAVIRVWARVSAGEFAAVEVGRIGVFEALRCWRKGD